MMVYGDLTWKREGLILGPADFLINYVLPFVATILFWLYKYARVFFVFYFLNSTFLESFFTLPNNDRFC
jgi:hypothetical protein